MVQPIGIVILPNGKIIYYNNNLYYGYNNIQIGTYAQILDALSIANQALNTANNKSTSVLGSYVGNGGNSSASPTTITFQSKPKFVVIFETSTSIPYIFFSIYGVSYFWTYLVNASGFTGYGQQNITWGDNSISFYSNDYNSVTQMNRSGTTYIYFASL